MPKSVAKSLSFYYCIHFLELLNFLASENCYNLLLTLNLIYNCEIRKAPVLCLFFEISLRP